jgi:EAL domain-containing protein (putative c-di-GMP-specific phosphodiesterase class I)
MVIDDFGTGYFSLSHLRQFPVDALKIASEFVQDSETGTRSSALAGAIVALSRSLAIQTVAEGIETMEQADRMRQLGCTYGQGFYFSVPVGGAEIVAGLDRPDLERAEREAAAEALLGDTAPGTTGRRSGLKPARTPAGA